MFFGLDQTQLAFLLLTAVAAGGAVLALAMPWLTSSGPEARIKGITAERGGPGSNRSARNSRTPEGRKDSRRKRVQDTLKQIDERQRRKRMTLRTLISRSGLGISVGQFWLVSAVTGVALALLALVLGAPFYVSILAGIVGCVGLPRWLLSTLSKRRQQHFIDELPDAVDVMVRGLKAGLPISDAMRVIAAESGPPIGPEFTEIVEGQRVGITIDQGLERMFERMPLPEVSFLGIVISIQSKSGGNLSEALNNLSRVLRERKKMKAKIRAVSQEAKSSAAIIGALPFLIILALSFLNPNYIAPLFTTSTGNIMLAVCAVWMLLGIFVMRQMINFDI